MIYIICGPTGSGKTSTAIKLADYLNCPIINADAFQNYKGMDIGTAKIDKNDPAYKKHYLIDFITPDKPYSVKEYQTAFRTTLDELLKSNKDIVVCGGTGLYIRASIYDYVFEEHEPDDVSDLEKMSNEELWEMLNKLDKEACKNIHPNNKKRVIRAISIARTNSVSKSKNIEMQEHKLVYKDVRVLLLNPDRELLYENINKRVDLMFEKGLINEVKSLSKLYELSLTARQAIGYKEVLEYLDGCLSLEACSDLIKRRTRNYAKRQVTFFKHQFDAESFASPNELLRALGVNG